MTFRSTGARCVDRGVPLFAIYARISSDDGTALGVQHQVEDCQALAAGVGWTVGDVYVDNDVSAWSTGASNGPTSGTATLVTPRSYASHAARQRDCA